MQIAGFLMERLKILIDYVICSLQSLYTIKCINIRPQQSCSLATLHVVFVLIHVHAIFNLKFVISVVYNVFLTVFDALCSFSYNSSSLQTFMLCIEF